MTRTAINLTALLVPALATVASADEVRSSIGYTASIPSDWTYLSAEELAGEAALKAELAEGADSIKDGKLRKEIARRMQTARIELFALPTGSNKFRDNINVNGDAKAQLPSSRYQAVLLKSVYQDQLSKLFGTPVVVNKTDLVTLPSGTAFFVDYEMKERGLRFLQYMMGSKPGHPVKLVVTGTYTTQTGEKNRVPFDKFVRSIRWKSVESQRLLAESTP